VVNTEINKIRTELSLSAELSDNLLLLITGSLSFCSHRLILVFIPILLHRITVTLTYYTIYCCCIKHSAQIV